MPTNIQRFLSNIHTSCIQEDLAAIFALVDQPLYANMEVIQTGNGRPLGRDYDSIGSPWEFKVCCACAVVDSIGCMGRLS